MSRDKLRTLVLLKRHSQSRERAWRHMGLPYSNESGKKKWTGQENVQDLITVHCATVVCTFTSWRYIATKTFSLCFRAAAGNTASYAVDCCGSCQESCQRKHTNIKYCNAELADYTKAAEFSWAASPFIYFFPACYHNYAIESFLWNILLNTIDSVHSLS